VQGIVATLTVDDEFSVTGNGKKREEAAIARRMRGIGADCQRCGGLRRRGRYGPCRQERRGGDETRRQGGAGAGRASWAREEEEAWGMRGWRAEEARGRELAEGAGYQSG